jgi:hypothetical protein
MAMSLCPEYAQDAGSRWSGRSINGVHYKHMMGCSAWVLVLSAVEGVEPSVSSAAETAGLERRGDGVVVVQELLDVQAAGVTALYEAKSLDYSFA